MKKNKMKKLAPLALVGLLTIGASAWLTTSDLADKTQSITAGTFSIEIQNEANAILNEQAIPVTDEVGKATTPYEFTVTNTGSIKQAIRLALNSDSGDLASNLVNVYITDANGAKVYEGTLEEMESADKGVGTVAVLAASESASYKVYAWIDDAAVNADLYGDAGDVVNAKEFKLEVLGIQADGGVDADSTIAAKDAYTESEFEAAATRASLTKSVIGG